MGHKHNRRYEGNEIRRKGEGRKRSLELREGGCKHSVMAKNMKTAFLAAPIATAAKMVIPVGGETWKALEHIRYMLLLILWLALRAIRSLLLNFPTSAIVSTFANTDPPTPTTQKEEALNCEAAERATLSGCGIGRALCQILALMNDTPVNSRKYEFIRNLAEKMIQENREHGSRALDEVNRMALSAGFARTMNLLNSSLQQQHDEEACSWTWRFLRRIPLRAIPLGLRLVPRLETLIRGFLTNLHLQAPPIQPPATISTDSVLAEKLAKELMWIAEKLALCSAMDEAILQWSSATRLADLSMWAHPRVQGTLARVSALMFKELARAREEESQVRLKMLVLWLPPFSYAMNGVDAPVLSAMERADMERVLESAVNKLSEVDQELVLSNWLRHYTISSSDWPNLGKCYNEWCHASRKRI